MLAGESLSEHCQACYQLEDKNVISARQEETVEWAMRLNLQTVDDLNNIIEPVYYEVRPSNTCNLMCRMCSPMFSSLIEKEQKQLGKIPQEYTEEYSNFDIVKIDGPDPEIPQPSAPAFMLSAFTRPKYGINLLRCGSTITSVNDSLIKL